MAVPNLKAMDTKALQRLVADAQHELALRSNSDRKAAIKKMREIAREAGSTLEELLGSGGQNGAAKARKPARPPEEGAAPTDKQGKRPPLYRNPEDKSQTWSGWARRPGWVLAHLEAGGTLDDLRIGRRAKKAA
jgi:DNA-binding protein H-NS